MSLKVKDVIKEMSAVGISLRKTEHGEFRVNYKGAGEGPAYYTDDLKDARDTGLEMARRGYKKNPMSAARYHRLMGPKGMAKFKRQTYRKGRPSLYKLYLQSVTARSVKGRKALSELARKRAGYSKKNPRQRRYRKGRK